MPPVSASPGNDSGRPGFIPALRQFRENPAQARAWLSERAPAIIGFTVPFLLVFYLAMREGGYGQVARGELGVAVWVVLLLGALAGLLRIPNSRSGWVGIGLLVAFAAWTGLAALWSESAERTAIETARVATMLGVFVLALCMQRAGTLRHTVAGVGAAIAIVTTLSLGSRLLPDLFPANQVADVLPTEVARLGYPLAYWNGMATLVAIGLPMLILAAGCASSLRLRAIACAWLPIYALTMFFTLSRGGVVEATIGVVTLLILMPQRMRITWPLAIGAAGSAVIVAFANARPELGEGLETELARDQGLEVLGLTVVVCALCALGNYLAQSRAGEWPAALPRVSRSTGRRIAAVGAVIFIVGAIVAGAPGRVSDNWTEFKEPATPSNDTSRFSSTSGSGRYQWWVSAADAGWSSPLKGIGPGTFEFWWARDDVEIVGFVRDAHSLYLETFGELGVIGFALIVAAVGGGLWVGVRRVRKADSDSEATLAAVATAAMVVFASAAAIDWSWELTVLPVTFLLLAAALIGGGRTDAVGSTRSVAVLPILAALSLMVILPPLLNKVYIDDSQEAAAQGNVVEAIEDARSASALLPFDASSHLQRALVLQLSGEFEAAAAEAEIATERESTNWRTWLVLSRIEADRGDEAAAEAALERSEELNPRSLLFQDPPAPTG